VTTANPLSAALGNAVASLDLYSLSSKALQATAALSAKVNNAITETSVPEVDSSQPSLA
jgi:hypothetical protein